MKVLQMQNLPGLTSARAWRRRRLALALLAGGNSSSGKIAGSLGLDEVGFKGGGDGDPVGSIAWRPLVFVIGANLAFGALLVGVPALGIPAFGLIVAIYALVLIASYARKEANFKECLILATVLAVGSYVVFVWALSLQFPVWPSFIAG